MVKHYYFGPISPQDHADMGGESFEFAGSYWSFKVEVSLDEGFVRLYDTVGRMVPIDQEHYNDLIATFNAVSALQEDFLEAKDAFKGALRALDSIHEDAVDAGIYVQGDFSYFVTE